MSREYLVAVVEDDESFRPALVESLSSLGYRVHDFPSAEDLIASGQDDVFDCVITDIHLTGMSGIDLKKLLTSRGIDVPVIMITARSDPGLENRAASSGAMCLLRKPFEIHELMACLKKALASNK